MKQLVCIVTILTLFLQLASCSKDLLHTKVRTVQKDSEWWNETETVVTPEEIMRTVGDKAHDVFVICFPTMKTRQSLIFRSMPKREKISQCTT